MSGVLATSTTGGLISVISTGGTISSRTDADGTRRPASPDRDLVAALRPGAAGGIRVVYPLSVSGFAMTPEDLRALSSAVTDQLADPRVTGVVIAHGTDTLEETAFFLQLFHADPRPVVLTGAIRPADDPRPDGPGNLRDAIQVAGSPGSRGRGVLVSFAGQVWAAAGTRKVDTAAPAAFASPDFGPVGALTEQNGPVFTIDAPPRPGPGRAHPDPGVSLPRVDIAAVYPGADATAMHAFTAAGTGARGLVLEGTGSGNAPAPFTTAVSELSGAGVVIALSSRVHGGPVEPLYGGAGGGREIVAAGAVPTGWLRPSQARIAPMVLLAADTDPRRVRATLTDWATNPRHIQGGTG